MIDYAVLVPTFNRHRLVGRLLDYFARRQLPCPIWIADSSAADSHLALRGLVQSYSALDVRLERFAPEVLPFHKVRDALYRVQSAFVALCGDDDFLIPQALAKAAAFLHDHPSYAVVEGCYRRFRDPGNKKTLQFWPIYEAESQEQERGADRLFSFIQSYHAIWYAVYRTEFLRSLMDMDVAYWERYCRADGFPGDSSTPEYLLEFATVIRGKLKRLPDLYCVREVCSTNYGKAAWPLGKILALPDYSTRYQSMQDALAAELVRVDGVTAENAKEVIDSAWTTLLAKLLPQDPMCRRTVSGHGEAGWPQRARALLGNVGVATGARRALTGLRHTASCIAQRLVNTGSADISREAEKELATISDCIRKHRSECQIRLGQCG